MLVVRVVRECGGVCNDLRTECSGVAKTRIISKIFGCWKHWINSAKTKQIDSKLSAFNNEQNVHTIMDYVRYWKQTYKCIIPSLFLNFLWKSVSLVIPMSFILKSLVQKQFKNSKNRPSNNPSSKICFIIIVYYSVSVNIKNILLLNQFKIDNIFISNRFCVRAFEFY